MMKKGVRAVLSVAVQVDAEDVVSRNSINIQEETPMDTTKPFPSAIHSDVLTSSDDGNPPANPTPLAAALADVGVLPARNAKHRMADDLLSLLAAAGIILTDPARVYCGEKAKDGLNASEVRCIDRIGVYAVTHMNLPVGFKLVIYPHAGASHREIIKYVKYLPRLLSRFGKRKRSEIATCDKVLYALKIEESRGGRIHIHLHCIADDYGMHEINCLKECLAKVAGYEVKLCKREPVYDGSMFLRVCKATGEILKESESFRRHAVHYLRHEFEDWRERATYIAKNLTRRSLGGFRSFHSSRVKP